MIKPDSQPLPVAWGEAIFDFCADDGGRAQSAGPPADDVICLEFVHA